MFQHTEKQNNRCKKSKNFANIRWSKIVTIILQIFNSAKVV